MNFTLAIDAVQPHVIAVGLISARLVPIAFLCPLLGGQVAPTHVKLGIVLALALFLHVGGGVAPHEVTSTLDYVGVAAKEMMLGTTLGLVASLPFDSARMGGRFIDLFRGSSAEAALPLAGTRESATGDALHQLLVALATTGGLMPLILQAIFRSYAWVPLGTFTHREAVATEVTTLVAGAFSTALAIGAPIAGLSLAADTLLGLASRASSGMNLQDVGAPLRILGGGAVLWLAIGVFAARLQSLALDTPELLRGLLVLGGGPG